MTRQQTNIRCTWCDRDVDPGDGFRLTEPAGERRATFCRLEHLVPWAIRGPAWEPGDFPGPPGTAEPLERCSQCGEPLPDTRLVLVRHRGEHRIPDGFCSLDHALAWAKAGGRWGTA